jgi:hypothetical protein
VALRPLSTPLFLVVFLAAAVPAFSQGAPAGELQRRIDALSAFDYAMRTAAARAIRRVPAAEAVPALSQAVRSHADQYVRYRALILLSGFNDPSTAALMRGLVGDRNDRVREVVYRWFERNPDPGLKAALLQAVITEQAEFVRPALIRAVAALPEDEDVRRTMIAEAGRGLDFFRSSVIEALGEHKAAYALDAVAGVAVIEGPLQDDAVMALGRMGERRAAVTLVSLKTPPQEVMPALQAAQCMLGDRCAERLAWLAEAARNQATRPEVMRAAFTALGAVAAHGNAEAIDVLFGLEGDRLRRDLALAFSGFALRRPDLALAWLGRAPDATRARAIELLREGFERLEEDFTEEQFYGAARSAYWAAAEGSAVRSLTATLIDKLEF